jgi:hypothetical protein
VLRLPLLLQNDTPQSKEVRVQSATMPRGWSERSGSGVYLVDAGATIAADVVIQSPAEEGREPTAISYSADAGGQPIGTVSLRVQLHRGGLPQ